MHVTGFSRDICQAYICIFNTTCVQWDGSGLAAIGYGNGVVCSVCLIRCIHICNRIQLHGISRLVRRHDSGGYRADVLECCAEVLECFFEGLGSLSLSRARALGMDLARCAGWGKKKAFEEGLELCSCGLLLWVLGVDGL